MPFIDRNSIALISANQRSGGRASLHTGAPPTDENRITEAGYATEAGSGVAVGGWFGEGDSSAGIGFGTTPAFVQYAECDFRAAGGLNPVVPDGTRIRSIRFQWPLGAVGGTGGEWTTLCWAHLDLDFPAPNDAARVFFREPGSLPADSSQFIAPSIVINRPPYDGRGGAAVDYSRARLTFRGEDWWAKWFRNHNVIRSFNETRARAAIGNATLVLSDTPGGPAPSAEWPRVGGIGIASKRFIHGGAVETSLDLVNVREIVVPAAAVDRTIPAFWCIWGRGGVERPRVPEELRGVPWFYGAMMACSTGSRILEAGDELVIPAEALCCSMYGRWSDVAFIPPEPGQVMALRADTRDPERTALSWDAIRGAHGYLIQVADEPTFASPIHECVELGRRAILSGYPEQTWYARVGATNAAGRGLWSDTLAFVPGALGPPCTDLVVEVAETSLTWKWKVPSEDVERCEVEWTGHPDGDGTAEVTVSPGGEWQYPITGLPGPVDGAGTRVGLRVRTVFPQASPWEPLDDFVWGETAEPNMVPSPTGLVASFIGATLAEFDWTNPEGFPWSRWRLRWTRANPSTPVDGYIVRRRSRATVGGAVLGSQITIDVQAGEAREGPWSDPVSLMITLNDGMVERPDAPTGMAAVAQPSAVVLTWDLPEGVRYAKVEYSTQQPGEGRVEHDPVVFGERLVVPGFAGTVVRAKAYSSANRAGTILSEEATREVTATIATEVPSPLAFVVAPASGGVRMIWANAEGVAGTIIQWELREESFAANPSGRVAATSRIDVAVPESRQFVPARSGWWIRARARHRTEAGAASTWTLWEEEQIPVVLQAPQSFSLSAAGGGDISASWVDSPTALSVVEIEVATEVPSGSVIGERRVLIRDGSRGAVLDTRQVASKTIRARARYASGVTPGVGGRAFGPFSPWTDEVSESVVLAAPEVSGVVTSDSITITFNQMTGARYFDYKPKGAPAWFLDVGPELEIPNLEASTTYGYEFRARNDGAISETTEESFTTLSTTATIPASPTVTFARSTTTTATWTIGLVSNASRHEYAISADGPWTTDDTGSVTLTELSPGTSYTLYVRACNAAGCSDPPASAAGSTQSVGGPTCPPRPAQTTATFTSATNSISGLIAAVAGAASYQYRVGSGSWLDANSQRRFTIPNLQSATAYQIEVRARARFVAGCESTRNGPARQYSENTLGDDDVPSPTASVTRTSSSLRVQINAVTGNPTGYQARIRTGSTGSWGAWRNADARRRRTFSNLSAGTAYNVEVRAVRGDDESESNNVYAWKTLPARPTARETVGRSSIAAVISAVTGADRYRWRAAATAGALGAWNNIASGGRSFSIPGLAPGTTRVVEVAAGHDQGWSTARRYTWRTTAALGVPQITALSAAATLVDLVLSAVSGATFYDYSLNGGAWILDVGRTPRITSLAAGTSHTVEVRARTATELSGSSSRSFWTPPAATSASLSSSTQTSLTGLIAAVTGATSYQYRVASTSAGVASAAWQNASGRNFTISSLSASTTRYVQVRAVGRGGNGAASPTYNWTTASALPAAPTFSGWRQRTYRTPRTEFLEGIDITSASVTVSAAYPFDALHGSYRSVLRSGIVISNRISRAGFGLVSSYTSSAGFHYGTTPFSSASIRIRVRRASDGVWSEWGEGSHNF